MAGAQPEARSNIAMYSNIALISQLVCGQCQREVWYHLSTIAGVYVRARSRLATNRAPFNSSGYGYELGVSRLHWTFFNFDLPPVFLGLPPFAVLGLEAFVATPFTEAVAAALLAALSLWSSMFFATLPQTRITRPSTTSAHIAH